MRRFALFVWDKYYPNGAMNDFIGSFDDKDAAVKVGAAQVKGDTLARYQVWDAVEMQEVAFDFGVDV